MAFLIIIPVLILLAITILIINQETPEDKARDEKYKSSSHKISNTFNEIRDTVKSKDKKEKKKK